MRLLLPAIALLSLALSAVGCEADDSPLIAETKLGCAPSAEQPVCVTDFINTAHATDRANEWSVRVQCRDDRRHYWLDTGAPAYDGVDCIVNAACETVCEVGGFRPALPCWAEYDQEAWAEVWRG